MEILSFQTNAVAFQELNLNRVDAFVSGSITIAQFMATSGGQFEIGGMPVAPASAMTTNVHRVAPGGGGSVIARGGGAGNDRPDDSVFADGGGDIRQDG